MIQVGWLWACHITGDGGGSDGSGGLAMGEVKVMGGGGALWGSYGVVIGHCLWCQLLSSGLSTEKHQTEQLERLSV